MNINQNEAFYMPRTLLLVAHIQTDSSQRKLVGYFFLFEQTESKSYSIFHTEHDFSICLPSFSDVVIKYLNYSETYLLYILFYYILIFYYFIIYYLYTNLYTNFLIIHIFQM